MKGAYIVRLNLNEQHLLGVAKKISSQVLALSHSMSGVDTYYLNASQIMKNDEVVQSYGASSLWRRMTYYCLFYLFIARQQLDVDFVYIRYQRSSPVFLYMLSRLKKKNPNLVILLELPSFPYHTEEVTYRDKIFGLIDRISRVYLHHYVDRIVTFSKCTEIFNIKTICTDNGVDVDSLKLTTELNNSDTVEFIGVANLSFWHGYDRILSGLAQYYKKDECKDNRKVIFNIVGSGHELERLEEAVQQFKLESYVKFHGAMHGVALDDLITQNHIGVSSVGMHRLDVDTSNLKSREFCARGLPFILAYQDRDFKQEFPYAFHAPANDEPIDIAAILKFYDDLVGQQPGYRQKMRDYAQRQLTWKAKMLPVVSAIEEIRFV